VSKPTLSTAFHRLAWSNLAAQSAEQIALAAISILAVLLLGADAVGTGLLQTAATLPFPLFALAAGILADRMSRGPLMASAEALRATALIAILILTLEGLLTLPLLAALGFIGACGTVAFSVAGPALVPGLVQRDALVIANGRIELARTTAFTAGPALGGALAGWAGGPAAFAVAAVLSFSAMLLLARIPEPPRVKAPSRNIARELREGIVFVFGHDLLRPIFITQLIFNTAFFMLQAIYAPYAIHRLGLSASGVGLTLSAYGIGMVAGALLGTRLTTSLRFGLVIAIGPLAGFAAAVVMLATIWVPSALLAATSFFLIGAGPIVWVISTTTLRQTVTPPELLGRASAINVMGYGARPLGAALGALIGGAFGTDMCLAVVAVGFLVQALVFLTSPVLRLDDQPAAA
jgi:predicted MFS family arabinose efflux permease